MSPNDPLQLLNYKPIGDVISLSTMYFSVLLVRHLENNPFIKSWKIPKTTPKPFEEYTMGSLMATMPYRVHRMLLARLAHIMGAYSDEESFLDTTYGITRRRMTCECGHADSGMAQTVPGTSSKVLHGAA